MASGLEFDVKEVVLSNNSFGPNEIDQLRSAIRGDYSQFGVLRDSVAELEVGEDRSPAAAVRLGVCYYILGRYTTARDTLQNSDGSALALFYVGKCQFALQDYAGAVASYEAAQTAGYDGDTCKLAIVESLRYQAKHDEAMSILDEMFGPIEQTAEYLYQRGATIAATGSNPLEVVALYERAVESSGGHPGALFGLALENERRGNDKDALRLYQMSANCFPSHEGTLMNLGILYEDLEEFDKAQQCYRRVLDIDPTNKRAKLFFKDAHASGDMYFDEDIKRAQDRLTQVLNIPVTDFELSVRSRNCLQNMGVHTLGDLTRTSEQELLASKNFGETSLIEIREMLNSKALELGQFVDSAPAPEPEVDYSNLSDDERAVYERPISDLNLSVRARKCMVRLGLSTIGELLRKSTDDLLECKNFGVTSLNEVKEKLTQMNLKLRGD